MADGKVSTVVVKVCLLEGTGFVSKQVCAILGVLSKNLVGSAVLLGFCCNCAVPVGDEVTWAVEEAFWFSSVLWLGPAQVTCEVRSVDSRDATIVLTFSLNTRTTVWVLGT